jgi:hypothetical protein
MSGTNEDRPQGPIWIAQRMEGDEVKFLRRATDEDVSGQAYKWSLSQTEEDVEGQATTWKGLGQTEGDVEGQLWKNGLAPSDDTEGQMLLMQLYVPEDIDLSDRVVRIRTDAPDDAPEDVEGQTSRYSG